jgi:hypothetical protein
MKDSEAVEVKPHPFLTSAIIYRGVLHRPADLEMRGERGKPCVPIVQDAGWAPLTGWIFWKI